MIIERLEFDLDVRRLHDFVDLAVLLPADELSVFVGKLNLEPNFMMESLRESINHASNAYRRRLCRIADLDNIQLGNHIDGCTNFVFKAVHLKAHALEDDFCT